MMEWLAIILGILAAFAIYIAAQCGRNAAAPADHLDAGRGLPAWAYIFAGGGLVLATFGPYDHLRLVSIYGLQANHLALALIPVALVAALFQKRVWLAARIGGARTIGDAMGSHFQSPSIRIYLLAVLFLFALPLAAHLLAETEELLGIASSGSMPRLPAIAGIAATLFLFSVLGGWRAVIFVCAALSVLAVTLMIFVAGFAAAVFDAAAMLRSDFAAHDGILMDAIPGVIQFTAGIGRALPTGGLWTTAAALSFAVAAIGIALSPGFAFLGLTTRIGNAFAFSQVWVMAGLCGGVLLLVGPLFGVALSADRAGGLATLLDRLGSIDQLLAACAVMMLMAALFIAIAIFAASGANIVTIELLDRYVVPGLSGRGQRLTARISLAAMYAALVLLAGFLPGVSAAFAPLALSLSAQLFPAYLGLCWLPWISRSAVLTGLILGTLVVLFTEPPGLIFFNGLFVELPWGRWPLTIHSAGWGLVVNIVACLLVALFTRQDAERAQRDRLHDVFRRDHRMDFGGNAVRGAKWSLTLLWTFFALGPAAILGNDFFSKPLFTGADVALGAPSLWVWQIAFWIMGVMIVWWLAYRSRLSILSTDRVREGELAAGRAAIGAPVRPRWIELLLVRITGRDDVAATGR